MSGSRQTGWRQSGSLPEEPDRNRPERGETDLAIRVPTNGRGAAHATAPTYSGLFPRPELTGPRAGESPESRSAGRDKQVPPWRLPVLLFIATCLSTLLVGGPSYAATVMFILLAHEFGHYLQARRYGVPASLPFFIPMPFTPIGTMGAVIAMRPHAANNRALFDLAITGPIAGLIPSLAASYVGLRMSTAAPIDEEAGNFLRLGEPLIFKLLSHLAFGPLEEGVEVTLHPVAFAGWVGIFITALNLLPIGQLDGGHILYTLLPGRAHQVSLALMAAAVVAVVLGGYWQWTLMLLILVLIGVRHPPTVGDLPLGTPRTVLGILTLAFVVVGFTPQPFII